MGNVQQLQIAKKELSLPGSGMVVFPKKRVLKFPPKILSINS